MARLVCEACEAVVARDVPQAMAAHVARTLCWRCQGSPGARSRRAA